MKTVSIFLASSITDLHAERMETGNFIRILNDSLPEPGGEIYFRLDMCEFIDDEVADTRKQDVYNKMIRDSDLCVFLFRRRAGQYTREELDAARAAQREKGLPRISVFFLEMPSDEIEPSVGELRVELDAEGFPYTRCGHIAPILLRILMELAADPDNGLDVKRAEDGGVMLNGKRLREIDPSRLPPQASDGVSRP